MTGPPALADPTARLRAAGLRVTAPRLAVLGVLDGMPGHLDVAQVAAAARASGGALSTQAVYDILAAFTDAGLVRRIEPAGHPARFEARVRDNHHHLVCRGCGEIRDVDCRHGTAPCLDPVDPAGFAVDEAEVTYWGLCPACSTASPAPSTAPAQPKEHR